MKITQKSITCFKEKQISTISESEIREWRQGQVTRKFKESILELQAELKDDLVLMSEKDVPKTQGKILALQGVIDYLQEEII